MYALRADSMTAELEQRISAQIAREEGRLRSFIRRRVANASDVEDILQDVFAELVESYRLMKPVEQAGAWLFRVARNRITDLFRKRRAQALSELQSDTSADEPAGLEELLPSMEAGPEAAYARSVLLDELDAALDELPAGQREAFVAHELEGRSFKELAAQTGLSVNTLLSRKRYAVLYLRERLQSIYDDFFDQVTR
jgi:RNA polymerase sigma factor (sigma-70 family)